MGKLFPPSNLLPLLGVTVCSLVCSQASVIFPVLLNEFQLRMEVSLYLDNLKGKICYEPRRERDLEYQ